MRTDTEFQRVDLRALEKYFGYNPWRTIPKYFKSYEGCPSKISKQTNKQKFIPIVSHIIIHNKNNSHHLGGIEINQYWLA